MMFKRREPGGGGRHFLKLQPGESVKGVFRGEPFDFKSHWRDGRSAVCTGEACELCKASVRRNFKFRVNFVTNENGVYVAKIFEQGGIIYDYLRSLHGADYDLAKTVVKITRQGSGKDTTYQIVPLPNGVLTPELEAKVAQVKLHDLANPTENGRDDADGQDDEVPF